MEVWGRRRPADGFGTGILGMKHLGRATRTAAVGGRWLGFELLERRDLLAVMRLVDWNTLNGPNDATGGR